MNKQLVSSLVDVVLNLSPEDQKLFQQTPTPIYDSMETVEG